jgi:hypothetical protein
MSVPKNWLLGGWYRRELIIHKQILTLKYYGKIPYIIQLYYEFSLLHIFSLVLQPWMSAYIRKTDGVYISVPKND